MKTLERKGCIVIQERETLRLLQDSNPTEDQPKSLTSPQNQALELINSLHSFSTVLLHGVTGSGKTEVYLQAIAPILAQKKNLLLY